MGRGGFMMWWRMGRRSLGALALLFGLIAGYAPQSAEAQMKVPGGYSPSINADGTQIAFGSYYDLTGDNLLVNGHVFLWNSDSGITQVSNTFYSYDSNPSINSDGTRIAFVSSGNPTGGNPDGNYELFLWTQGVGFTQLTNTTGNKVYVNPSINSDGTRIAFVSSADLTPGVPGNADGNTELFLWTQGVGFTQLTNTTDPFIPVLLSPSTAATGVSITPTFAWSGVEWANRYWLMVATNLADLPTDPTATSCPNCVISGSTDATSYAAPFAFPFGGRSGTLSVNTTYYWKVQAWNTNGSLANYSTASRFTTGQPELTEPQRVETSVDPTTLDPTPDRKAVVITHGWRDNASTWVEEMAKAFCKRLNNGSLPVVEFVVKENGPTRVCEGVNGWDVWVYDWRKDAEWWAGWEFVGGGIIPPWNVYVNAISLGEKLADILKIKNYQHIHFIAHSAGANLIDYATRGLWNLVRHENRPALTIHETFLDAYDPSKELSPYGMLADWADNYVDTRNVDPVVLAGFDGTKLFLKNAYSIDVTPRGIDVTLGLDCGPVILGVVPEEIQAPCRHDRPVRFYGESIAGDGSFIGGDPIHKVYDPIDGTAGMGYPLSVENGLTLGTPGELGTLSNIFPPGGKCIVQGGLCYQDALPPSTLHFLPTAAAEVVVDGVTTAVDYIQGTGDYLLNLLKMGWSLVPGLAPQQMHAMNNSPSPGAATEAPSYLVINVTTTTPVNTLRFNWSFDTAGEGLLRVFVGGNLVRQTDQRHVTPSSPTTEEVYIGGEGVPLPPGTHRITFRFDGFGASASGVELTDVELGMLTTPLVLSTANLPTGEVGTSYAYGLQAEGGAPPYTWSLASGRRNRLPQGFTLASDGTITGVPTRARTTSFTVQVTDALGASVTRNLSLQVVKGVKLMTRRLTPGTVGVPYLATLQATGGIPPLVFSLVGGALPPGLTLNPATGLISGTPTAAGIFDFVVQVTSSGGSSNQKALRITIG